MIDELVAAIAAHDEWAVRYAEGQATRRAARSSNGNRGKAGGGITETDALLGVTVRAAAELGISTIELSGRIADARRRRPGPEHVRWAVELVVEEAIRDA